MAHGSGVPYWIFWLMAAIIVILATIILVRDKGVRTAIKKAFKKIFKRIEKEIHQAKIKAAIAREKEHIAQLQETLGREIHQKRIPIEARGAANIQAGLETLDRKENLLERQIREIQQEIQDSETAYRQKREKLETGIKQQEDRGAPEEEKLNRLKKELAHLKKAAWEKEKLKTKTEKKIAAQREKIKEINEDEDLSTIEKEMKTGEVQETIAAAARGLEQLTRDLASLNHGKQQPQKEFDQAAARAARHRERIRQLKEETKNLDSEYDAVNREQLRKKGSLTGKKSQLARRREEQHQRLGEIAAGHRPGNPELRGTYAELDRVRKRLAALENSLVNSLPAPG
jgi:chromosome segregation ATPase